MFNFFGGKKESAEAALSIERQLEKLDTELQDKIERVRTMQQGLGARELTAEDRNFIAQTTGEAAGAGINPVELSAYLEGREYVAPGPEAPGENMVIDSVEAFHKLYSENETARAVIDKAVSGELTATDVADRLTDAGYELPDDFDNWVEAMGGNPAPTGEVVPFPEATEAPEEERKEAA